MWGGLVSKEETPPSFLRDLGREGKGDVIQSSDRGYGELTLMFLLLLDALILGNSFLSSSSSSSFASSFIGARYAT